MHHLMITANVGAHCLVLMPHNLAEFSRVPGLLFENWQEP